MRHGIAFEQDASRWPDDRDRPLTDEGQAAFRKASRGLSRIVSRVDVLLSSPLVRARQTAEILTEEAGWPEPASADALEPERAAPDVVEALRPYASEDTVAVVGHEPQLGRVIAFLLTGSDDSDSFSLKKGGAACVAFEGFPPEEAVLRWLLTPKIERALRS